MRTIVCAVLAAAVTVALCGCGGGGRRRDGGNAPRGERWEKLGSRMVNHRAERDEIHANFQGDFLAIRIDVDRADLEMFDVDVVFGNNEHWDASIRHHFREGSWSRRIDLPGHVRHIRKVVFKYRTAHRGEGRANVDLYGLHPN